MRVQSCVPGAFLAHVLRRTMLYADVHLLPLCCGLTFLSRPYTLVTRTVWIVLYGSYCMAFPPRPCPITQAAGNLDNVTGQCCAIPGTGGFPPNNFSGCLNANPGMAVSGTTVCNEEPLETTDYRTATIAIENMRNLSATAKEHARANANARPWFLAVGLHKPHPYWPVEIPLSNR